MELGLSLQEDLNSVNGKDGQLNFIVVPNILQSSQDQNLLDCNSCGQVLKVSWVKELRFLQSKLPTGLEEDVKVVLDKEQNKDEVCPPSEAKNNHSRILWQGHSLQLIASKVHIAREQTRMGRSMCVANQKRPSAEHTQTHMHGGEAACQELTDSSKATCGLGQGGDKAKTRKYDIRIVQSHPTGHANAKNDTHRSTIPAAVSFSHPETVPSPPCRALTT